MNSSATRMNSPQAVDGTGKAAGSDALPARLRRLARQIRQSYLQVFGIPDYERYVAHRTEHHPGEPLLTRQKFFAEAIDRKYCRNGARCC